MAILRKFILRYTSISAAIDVLRRQQIVLLDPQNWDNKNDRYFMNLYKEAQKIGGLYGLCASRATETYHHWRVFTGASDGACIELKRLPLEKMLKLRSGFRFGKIQYMMYRDLEELTGNDVDRLPFVKRHGFKDEAEYRIIGETSDPQQAAYSIPIELAWINRITINPWLPDTIAESVISSLKQQPGCGNLRVQKSVLINSSRWRKGGDHLVSKGAALAKPKL